jgi:hypothetical protein
METSGNLKKWLWNNDGDGRKIRDASLERAEQMVAESAIDTAGKIKNIRSFSDFMVIRFRCSDCRDFNGWRTYHFWGGTKKYAMDIDYAALCPKGGKHMAMASVHKNVYPGDAWQYASDFMRHLIRRDERQNTLNPFL